MMKPPFWKSLQAIRTTQFNIKEKGEHLLHGRGDVTIIPLSSDSFLLEESGIWELADGQQVEYRNRYRWTWDDGNCIQIAQWRGDEPVHLVTLRQNGEEWHTDCPHLCGSDRYSAVFYPAQLQLHWKIVGEKKDHLIFTQYSTR